MAKTVQLIRIFLGSPGDLGEERQIAETVINEINRVLAPRLGLYLELIKWETHTMAGFGSDAQAVINEQINDNYDIFVGILYRRFGTPTSRAESGTTEEFYRAYERFKNSPSSIRILFYFKTKEFFPGPNEIEQLSKVFKFKAELAKLGGLYSEFKEAADFETVLRLHLSKHLNDWNSKWGGVESSGESAVKSDGAKILVTRADVDGEHPGEPEEVGLFELGDIANHNLANALCATQRLTEHLDELNRRLLDHTEESNILMAVKSEKKPADIREIMERAAKTIDAFAASVEEEVPTFSESYRAAHDAVSKSISLFDQFGSSGEVSKAHLVASLKTSIEIIERAEGMLGGMQNAIRAIPPLTTSLSKARRRAGSALDRLRQEFEAIQTTAEQIVKSTESGTAGPPATE